MTRIFGWQSDAGTGYWRLRLPLTELAKAGHDVMVDERMPDCMRYDAQADVFIAARTANPAPSATFRRLAAERRMLCVYECDDDFFTVTPDNKHAHRLFVQGRSTQMAATGLGRISSTDIDLPAQHYLTAEVQLDVAGEVRANMAAAHLLTVSTDYLAGVVGQHTDAPIVVLPNRVPRWLTELPAPWEREPATLTVAHTGGPSHVRDFGECAKPLRAWLNRQADRAEFASYGLDSTGRVRGTRGRARHVRWQGSVEAYLRSLTGVDIGLAPLRGTAFDLSKSPLKAMEWGALGVPVVASNVEPYASYVRHGVTGILCSTHKEWREALDALRDPDLRHTMGLAGRLQACEHLVEDHAHEWLDAYQGAMSRSAAA